MIGYCSLGPIPGGFSGKAGWTCQKRKRPDHSGLPMRTKRLNYRSQPRYHELFVGCGAAVERLASHTVTCICASTTQSMYQIPCPLPVTSSGYIQLRSCSIALELKSDPKLGWIFQGEKSSMKTEYFLYDRIQKTIVLHPRITVFLDGCFSSQKHDCTKQAKWRFVLAGGD